MEVKYSIHLQVLAILFSPPPPSSHPLCYIGGGGSEGGKGGLEGGLTLPGAV